MLDPYFLVPILISLSALLLSLYRELKGPDISLLNEKPSFRLTDKDFSWDETYIPNWFSLNEISLVFANYGGKGGTILNAKLQFSPREELKDFFVSFDADISGLPLTIKDGETCVLKFKPSIHTIDWKKSALMEILQRNHSLPDSIDKSILEGREKFERFCSLLAGFEELGEISGTASVTMGRLWTKVKDKRFFSKIKLKNDYDKTIDSLRKRLQNWDQLEPTRTQILNSLLRVPRNLRSELKANSEILGSEITEESIGESKLREDSWRNLARERYHDETEWFVISRETNLKENLEQLYTQISKYNSRIDELLRLGERRTEKDFERPNKKRTELHREIGNVIQRIECIPEV